MTSTADDEKWMKRAIEIAWQGQGWVEPNPMVGCVIVRDGKLLGEGWHRRFGGNHAEVDALGNCNSDAAGATAFVTLEPCAHHGKTPPCVEALVSAGVSRVVIGLADPNPAVDHRGITALRGAGIKVDIGVAAASASELVRPYRKLLRSGRPWVIAKWAMSLDGKIATSTGDSRWISGEQSRRVAHELRGRVDAIIVGRKTVDLDDPLLTARPPGSRIATRIVLDSQCRTRLDSQLVKSISVAPLIVVTAPTADESRVSELQSIGAGVQLIEGNTPGDRVANLLDWLGQQEMTNVMVEGGGETLGAFFDSGNVDEIHAFIAPKIIGGAAQSPVGGDGWETMNEVLKLESTRIQRLESDVYVHGFATAEADSSRDIGNETNS